MKRQWIIWIIYAAGILFAFSLSSCAASKPRYVAQTGEVRTRTNEKQRTIMVFHLATLAMMGWIYHAFNEPSK